MTFGRAGLIVLESVAYLAVGFVTCYGLADIYFHIIDRFKGNNTNECPDESKRLRQAGHSHE